MKKYIYYPIGFSFILFLGFLTIDYILPLPKEKLEAGYGIQVLDRDKLILRCYLSNDDISTKDFGIVCNTLKKIIYRSFKHKFKL